MIFYQIVSDKSSVIIPNSTISTYSSYCFQTEGQTDRQTNGQMGGRGDRRTDGQTEDGWTDGRIGGYGEIQTAVKAVQKYIYNKYNIW